MKLWRARQREARVVVDGEVACPLTHANVDLESCLSCARLGGVTGDSTGDAPLAVRCRLDRSWREVPLWSIS